MARIVLAGCGYVGLALADLLLSEGHEVWGVRRSPCPTPEGLQLLLADLRDPTGLAAVLPPDLDHAVYTASADTSSEAAYRAAYLEGLQNVLSSLRLSSPRLQRFLFASSTSVYAQDDGSWVEEDSPAQASHFSGRTLLEAEALLKATPFSSFSSITSFSSFSSFSSIALRFGGIYGPGRTRLLDSVRSQTARCPAGPPVYTNRIHRDDCAGVLHHLLFLPDPLPCYVAVDDHPADTSEVLRWLAQALGLPPPPTASEGHRSDRTLRSNKRCSNQKLRRSGYVMRYPTYREGYATVLAEARQAGLL